MSDLSLQANDSCGPIDWPLELENHKPWLLKVLRCRIGNRHEAEDLYQDIAVQVLKQSGVTNDEASKPGESRQLSRQPNVPCDPGKVAPWLYRIAVRQAVNFHRRMNRKSHAHPTDDLEPVADNPEPLQWLLDREQAMSIQQAIEDLRPQDREILTLKYSENWNYQQLSEHLGVPTGSIEYRLAEARKRLRKKLSPFHKISKS